MAAAVTTTSSNNTHTNNKMSSPKDSKQNAVLKNEDPPVSQSDDAGDVKPVNNPKALAPPPKPSQNNPDSGDYFTTNHNNPNNFSLEPNPFEQSFGNPSSDAPNRLPPVASITSPSPLPGVTPGWNSLRAGPLSPAMLAGPAGGSDYFSDSFRGGFPTPNESSLRTGLTPGGGGSMFPAPSPTSQALFNLQSGGVTPGTLDFHRTALNAAAAANNKFNNSQNASSSQAPEQSGTQATDSAPTQQSTRSSPPQSKGQMTNGVSRNSQQNRQQDLFGSHDVSSAANDLLSFASQVNGASRNQQYPVSAPNNSSIHNRTGSVQDPKHGSKGSIDTNMSGSVSGDNSESGQSEHAKPVGRNNKKGAAKGGANRRKADEPKGGVNKKQKGNHGMPQFDDEDSEDDDMKHDDEIGANGKKMTDEEKRKNFLERNRVAALKCRQRKKQWLANLQAKVELFSTENDALSAQVTQLREEVVNLKTLLLAHKDCPVSQAQGLGGMAMNSFIGEVNHHANPYGMAMNNGMMQMGQGQMQRS